MKFPILAFSTGAKKGKRATKHISKRLLIYSATTNTPTPNIKVLTLFWWMVKVVLEISELSPPNQ